MGIKLKVVTPDGIFINDKDVDIINVQTIDGDMGIMKGMVPIVSALRIGTMSFRINNSVTYVHLHRGILKVAPDECKIITQRLYLVNESGQKLSTPTKLD